MKYIKLKKALFSLLMACGMIFSACEKVDKFEPIGNGGQKIFSISQYGGTESNFSNSALVFADPSATSKPLELKIDYSTPAVSDKDITITVGVNAAAVARQKGDILPVL